jgi:hypothetical protein
MRHDQIDIFGTGDVDVTRPWYPRLKQLAAAVFLVAFLVIQILMPLVQFVRAPRPARFGWQMYSVASTAPRFELIMPDGNTKPLDITPYVTSLRGDVPLARFLPQHLCALFPDAAAVHYQMADDSQAGIYQCNV